MKTIFSFRKSSSTKLTVIFLLTFSIFSSNNYCQSPTDFSGTWKLDLSKSTSLPNILSATLVITQKENDLSINRTFEIKDHDPLISKFNYTIGSINESSSKTGIITVSSSWGTDKQTFSIIETVISDKDGTKQMSKRTSVYSLSEDCNTLNIISDDTLPEGSLTPESERHMKFVYIKS